MNIAYIRCTEIYNDSRATKEILTFLKSGYSVFVVGWDRNGKAYNECKNIFAQFQEQIKFYFFDVRLPNGIGIKNINKIFKWFRFVNKTLTELKDINVVHACDLDCGLPSLRYVKKNDIKLVYDIFDYYIDSHNIPAFLKRFIEKKEIRCINGSDLTIICTNERLEQISKASPNKVIVIHNTPDIKDQIDTNNHAKYDYVYCGALFPSRMVDLIFESYCKKNEDLKFCIAGNGPCETVAENLGKDHQNFTFLGAINYDLVLRIESQSLCLSAIYDPSFRNHKLCAPNKFYEALALGKPQIVCKGTGIDKIVADNNIGLVIEYDVNEFYKAIRWFKEHPTESAEMGKRARKLYEKQFKWSYMSKVLVEAYNEL